MARDPRIDAYIAAQADFARPILTELRERLHAACPGVTESIKWSMPAFSYQGRPLAGIAAFKAYASFGFWDRAAMATGREGEAMGQRGKLASLDDLPDPAVFAAMVRHAMALIDAGTWATKAAGPAKAESAIPEALAEALARDDMAAATFAAFPPSARREYCEWIADAKRPATRDQRIATAIEWLREGKKRHWKYERC